MRKPRVQPANARTVAIIVEDIMRFAEDARAERESKHSSYDAGVAMGHYQVISALQDTLIILELEPEDVRLDFDVAEYFFASKNE